MQRLTKPRIAPLPLAEWDSELRARFERPGGLDDIFNVMKTLANYPELFRRWIVFVSGMMIAATALLERNPNPSCDEIRTAMDGHLCRCGAHLRILRAITRAANEGAAATEGSPV